MRQAADRLAQHGFCLIWARPSEPNTLGISVYCVDPAHLLPPAADRIPARRESVFTDFFDKLLSQERIAYQVSLETLVDTLRGALGSSPCVTHLRDGHWDDDLEWLERSGAQPCEFRYWGMLADFSVRVATTPTARRHYGLPDAPRVEAPATGFQIIAAIIGNQPFKFGRITAKPIFQFGRLLRRAIDLATSNPADRVAWNWNQVRLMPFAVEVIYIAQSWPWVEPTPPEEPLVMFAPPNISTALNIMRFGTWVIDNQWREPTIDPNRYGFRPSGSIGARFFRLALSENAPLEIAFVVNTCSTRKQGGWDSEIDFQITSGLVPFRGAKLGFLVLQVKTYLLVERHTLLFDACDRHAHEAIEHLRRQAYIHLIVAREEGEIVAVQQPPNVFEFGELGSGLARVQPGENQDQARRLIMSHRGEIDAMLSVDLIAAVD